MTITLNSRNKKTTLSHKYSVTKCGHFLKENCVPLITSLWTDPSLINSGTLSQRNSARILSCYPPEYLWADQHPPPPPWKRMNRRGDQRQGCNSERELVGERKWLQEQVLRNPKSTLKTKDKGTKSVSLGLFRPDPAFRLWATYDCPSQLSWTSTLTWSAL